MWYKRLGLGSNFNVANPSASGSQKDSLGISSPSYGIFSMYKHQTRDQSKAWQNRKYDGMSSFRQMELSR